MKKNNFRMLALMLLSMMGITVSAHDIEVANADGVTIYFNYTTDGTELEVTFRGEKSNSYYDEYSGKVVIPDEVMYEGKTFKVTGIGKEAFLHCTVNSITIPNSVTSIRDGAFWGCSGLTSVIIPNSVTSIEGGAFVFCSGLTSVTLPNSLTTIKDNVFNGCTSLASITIPNSVTNIEMHAFKDCRGLTSITIPSSVTVIGYDAFSGCSGLTSVSIPNSVTTLDNGVFYSCSGLTSVIIPNSVTSIGGAAFGNCTGLTSIIIPNSVTSIGNYAFDGCSNLTSVTIGSNVTYIGWAAFYDSNLISVISLIENPFALFERYDCPFNDDTFNNAKLYVPKGTIDKYKSTGGWMKFVNIEVVGVEETKKCATPTISIVNGELEFSCETEGVEYVSEVTVADAKKNYSSKVSLTGVYKVSVYATKDGYENSDVATAEFTMSGGGMKGDVNVDGKVNALDIQEVINIAAAVE